MNTAEWILVAILSLTLFVFLIIGIVLLVKLIGLSKEVKKVVIEGQDIADFYRMLQDFRRNRGNTFVTLQLQIEDRFPKLKEQYGNTSED